MRDVKSHARLWGQSSEGGEMKHESFPLSLAPLFFFFFFWRGVGDYNMITEQGNFRKQRVL